MTDIIQREPAIPVVSGIVDPIRAGRKAGWYMKSATEFKGGEVLEADVLIIGTGAGGSTSAEIFAKAGLKVLMIEEGPLKSSDDFKMDERDAYHDLYQRKRRTHEQRRRYVDSARPWRRRHHRHQLDLQLPHARPTLEHWAKEFGVKA